MEKEKIWILGARRGLGREILKQWQLKGAPADLAATSRKPFEVPGVQTRLVDFSRSQHIDDLIQHWQKEPPHRVFCIAGGGPYGPYAEKSWKDHDWALQVTLTTPLKLIHFLLQQKEVRQIICVGSAIAEDQPDPGAASYSAAKHGLKGAISSLQSETSKDLRLFSPGYMQTDMLPEAVHDQLSGSWAVEAPQILAESFVTWAQNPQASWHWKSRPT